MFTLQSVSGVCLVFAVFISERIPKTKGENLAICCQGASFSLNVVKRRCQVSFLVWFHG